MSLTSDYLRAKKQLEKQKKIETANVGASAGDSFTREYQKKKKQYEDGTLLAPIRTTVGTVSGNIAPIDRHKLSSVLAKSSEEKEINEKSFAEVYEELRQQRFAELEALKKNGAGKVTAAEDIYSRKKEEKEDERKWFQKGLFKDGYDFGDVTKTILGTGADIGEDLLTGLLGMGEKAVDAVAMIAPYVTQGQYNAQFYDPNTRKVVDEMTEQAKGEMAEFVKKDLYDEQKVAQKILSAVPGGMRNAAITMNGGQLTQGDMELWRQSQQETEKYIQDRMELESVLGEKSDALVQSAGQLAGQYGLTAVGVPWWLTAGATSLGAEAENALKQGATHAEATGSGLISAGAEIISEKLFGGDIFTKGGSDLVTNYLSRAVSDKALRTLAKLGYDAAGEGVEEIFSEFMGNLGSALYKEENLGEILFNEEALQGYLESFIGGGVLGGAMGGINAVQSNAQGKDFVTELTKNEQAVVDKVYKDEIAKQEQGGKKLTEKEKQKIYDKVLEDMDKGYISTETIEEVLGGEAYESYKKASEWEKSLTDEYDALDKEYRELLKMKRGDQNGEQQLREAELAELLPELKKRNENAKATSTLGQLQSQLQSQVKESVRGDRLVESYNEEARAYQDYEADMSQFEGLKHQDAVQKTLESIKAVGASNTNKVHDFLDSVVKISGDTGIAFTVKEGEQIKQDFIARQTAEIQKLESIENPTAEQTEKLAALKELLAQVESGKVTIDGDITDDGITLNLDSPKPLNRTVGHEVTHSLEKSKHYDALRDSLFAYAKSKGVDIQKELETRKLKYEGVTNANPEAELVADLVGDFLFTDGDYVRRLSVENRTVFEKIWDEIKHLCKLVTAGSKEARDLERVRKAFEDAYRESGTAAEREFSDADTKYSIRQSEPPKKTIVGYKVFVVKDGKLYPPMVANPEGEGTPVGVWLDADVGGLAYDKDGNVQLNERGRFKVKAGGKGTQGGGGELAFRPGWHLGEYPDASQFGRENSEKLVRNKKGEMVHPKELFPYNFVWAKCEVAADVDYQMDAMSFGVNENGVFERSQAGLPYIPEDGYYKYRTNANPDTAPWIISGSIKVTEILTDEQVAQICAEHGVTPQQRQGYTTKTKEIWPDAKTIRAELKQAGVQIPKGIKAPELRRLYSQTFPNVEIPTEITGYDGESRPGGQIDLSMFGLQPGEVVPTSEDVLDQIRQAESTASTRKAETLALLKKLPGYAKRKIDFADQNIIKEFGMNHQSVDYYRNMAERSGHGYLRDNKIYSDAKYSISAETDKAYFDAVFDDDWETAERLVEEAAKKAGYTKVVYHGTEARFTVFDTDEESTVREDHAWMADYPDGTIFLAESPEVADYYGDRVMNLLLDTSDVKVFEEPDMYAHRAMDDKYGYEVYNYPVIAVKGKDMTIYATLDNTAVKSADTVTIDDDGAIVPLSERFKRSNPDIRYSMSDARTYAEIEEEQRKLQQRKARLEERKREAVSNPELLQAMDDVSSMFEEMRGLLPKKRNGTATQEELDRIEELKANREDRINRVANLQKSLGLDAIAEEEREIRETQESLRVASDEAWAREGAERENKAIEKSGLSASEYFRKKALKAFRTTANFNEAGYLLPDGKLLNFSGGERNHRYRDHREIGEIYEATQGVHALNRFMSDGNIRIMAESPGIDIASGVEPTAEQYVALRRFINTNGLKDGQFFVDLSDTDGRSAGKYSYNGRIIADRIINDIKYFFKTGKVRESSGLTDFLSVSAQGEDFAPIGDDIFGKDIRKKSLEEETKANVDIPVRDDVAPVEDMFPDGDSIEDEIARLTAEREAIGEELKAMAEEEVDEATFDEEAWLARFNGLGKKYNAIDTRIAELEDEISRAEDERLNSLEESDIPPEMDAPIREERQAVTPTKKLVADISRELRHILPLKNNDMAGVRDIIGRYASGEIQTRDELVYEIQTNYGEHTDTYNDDTIAEVKNAIRTRGLNVSDTIKREVADYAYLMRHNRGRIRFSKTGLAVDEVWHELQEMYPGFFPDDVMSPTDQFLHIVDIANKESTITHTRPLDMEVIESAADAIIGAVGGHRLSQEEAFANRDARRNFDSLVKDGIAPPSQAAINVEYAPLKKATTDTQTAPIYQSKDKTAIPGQTTMIAPPPPNPSVATVLTKESAKTQKEPGVMGKVVGAVVDKGMVFENFSLESGNPEIQAKWDYALPSRTEARAQYFMEHGDKAKGVKSLKAIMKQAKGSEESFFDYLHHAHNIDRMTLEERFHVPNKTVFGETITADVSRGKVAEYEKAHPDFKAWAEDIYAYNRHLRNFLVENNVISQETADLWEKMYPHYVPIRRVGDFGLNVNVPLDTNKTGVNAPIKRAVGGSSDIEPLWGTMAMRTEQTFRAIARNSFGIELKNTLDTTINAQKNVAGVDEMIDTIEAQEDHLLKPGTFNSNPTFTVFENGERVEFEITEDMYDALKPANKILASRNKVITGMSNIRRNLLTTWNAVFAWYRNPVKDIQDVAINSQHAVKTYANVPLALKELFFGGKYAQEYHQNGGKGSTYFDSKTHKFSTEKSVFSKLIGLPVKPIEMAGEFIEEIPRLAEYMASRKQGRSIERSMLDAARVTTNFAAGGDFTKFLNSHGFTFLNASVQGASQHVRNFREAKQQGVKGWLKVAAKYTIAGLPTVLLNSLLWDDDEEYEELNDYVKQNYYVVAKTEDGKFVRIPKGRTAAVMGECFKQMENLVTGDDEADFSTFFRLFMDNIAPSNPIENNILVPFVQAHTNKAWYGGEIVPSRLQDLPMVEQFDESTDAFSKWFAETPLGDKMNISPVRLNYLIDQLSGGLGDAFLPMMTPEAESGDDSFGGKLLAPWKKELHTDSVLNNKNPGEFYELRDELEVMANSKNATDEDKLRALFMDNVGWDMSDLYAQKREVQNSDMSDSEKYDQIREIQEQINALAERAMFSYENVRIDGVYAEVSGQRFNKSSNGKWYEISADYDPYGYYEREQKVTKAFGIGYAEYWNNRDAYNDAYTVTNYNKAFETVRNVFDMSDYVEYVRGMKDLKADKDESGKTISGSKKEKVIDHINNLDADYGEKIILFKAQYPKDDTYNQDIIDYLNGRADISAQEMRTILEELGFTVDDEGYISWE